MLGGVAGIRRGKSGVIRVVEVYGIHVGEERRAIAQGTEAIAVGVVQVQLLIARAHQQGVFRVVGVGACNQAVIDIERIVLAVAINHATGNTARRGNKRVGINITQLKI